MRDSNILAVAIPVVLAAVLYGPFAFGTQFVMDDVQLLLHHARPGDVLGEWTHATQSFAMGTDGGDFTWRPLVASVHQLVGEVFGRTPVVFRLLNVVVHAVNVGLIAAMGARLGAARWVAAGAAVAWGIHPVLVDAICWACDTYDLLATTFLLLAVSVAFSKRSLPTRLPLAGALFLAALFSKEGAIAFAASLPIAVALRRGPREALAWLGLLGALGLGHEQLHRVVATGLEQPGALLSVDFLALWSDYATWMLRPPVGFGIPRVVPRGDVPWSLPGVLLVGSCLALSAALTARRDPRGVALAAGLAQWIVLLTPGVAAALMLGLQAGRYAYLPSAVAVVFLAALVPMGRLGAAGLVVWLALAGPATIERAARWHDPLTLSVGALQADPENPAAAQIAGRELVIRGHLDQGLRAWRYGIEHTPSSVRLLDPQQSRLDYAVAAARGGRIDEARTMLDAFIAVELSEGRTVSPSVRDLSESLQVTP